MKRIVSFLLLLCMLSTACVVCAAESKSDFTEESWMMEPFSSKLVLNSSIVGRTVSWSQSSGYTAYRVWVANTTTNQMKVTVTEPTGNKRAFMLQLAEISILMSIMQHTVYTLFHLTQEV